MIFKFRNSDSSSLYFEKTVLVKMKWHIIFISVESGEEGEFQKKRNTL